MPPDSDNTGQQDRITTSAAGGLHETRPLPGVDKQASELTSAASVEVNREDAEAVINLIERTIQMLRARWNDLPENERQAFVRLREVIDHA